MNPTSFAAQFDVVFSQDTVKIGDKLFIQTENQYIDDTVTYVGEYIGIQTKRFTPSHYFITHYLKDSPQFVQLDKKSAWLFICGRDIFSGSVKQKLTPDTYVVVRDNLGDIIGYGYVPREYSRDKQHVVAIKNILDRGQMLRREQS